MGAILLEIINNRVIQAAALAWAIARHLIETTKSFTLFATHYHELTELEGELPGVKNFRVTVREIGEDIVFLRKIVRGGADQSFGIQVARLAGLPELVLARAKEILEKLESADIAAKREPAKIETSVQPMLWMRHLRFSIASCWI